MKKLLGLFMMISTVALLLIVMAVYATDLRAEQDEQIKKEEEAYQKWLEPKVIAPEKIRQKALKALELDEIDTIYDMAYQNAVEKQVEKYKKKKRYTLQEPLLILNPYGTNRTGLYVYFQNIRRVTVEYNISVKDTTIPPFTGKLFTNVANKPLGDQEGQIIGLLPGYTNYVILYVYDETGAQIGKEGYKINVPDYGTVADLTLDAELSRQENQLTDGLFSVADGEEHILLYDKLGVVRAEIPLEDEVQISELDMVDNELFYAAGSRKFVQVDRLGKVEKVFSLGEKYRAKQDYDVTHHEDQVLILAEKSKKSDTEQTVLDLNLYTGEVTVASQEDAAAFLEAGQEKKDQTIQENIIRYSEADSFFEECNKDGNRIAGYHLDRQIPDLQVYKYDMKGYWFAD